MLPLEQLKFIFFVEQKFFFTTETSSVLINYKVIKKGEGICPCLRLFQVEIFNRFAAQSTHSYFKIYSHCSSMFEHTVFNEKLKGSVPQYLWPLKGSVPQYLCPRSIELMYMGTRATGKKIIIDFGFNFTEKFKI